MVDWESSEVVSLCFFLENQIVVFFLGVFLWHIILTLRHVELRLVTRRLRLRLAHAPYIIARYSQLTSLFLLVSLSRYHGLGTCRSIPMLRGLSVIGNVAVTAASSNLAIRALTIWRRNRVVQAMIIFLCFTHLVIAITLGILGVRAVWNADHTVCAEEEMANLALLPFSLSTVGLDLSILLFTVVGLHTQERSSAVISRVWSALFNQSIAYAALTCAMGIPIAVFARLGLNAAMDTIAVVPASTIRVMASSAAVTFLLRINDPALQRPHPCDQQADGLGAATKSCPSCDQLSTRISLSSLEYANSFDVSSFGPYGPSTSAQSSTNVAREGKNLVKVLHTEGDIASIA